MPALSWDEFLTGEQGLRSLSGTREYAPWGRYAYRGLPDHSFELYSSFDLYVQKQQGQKNQEGFAWDQLTDEEIRAGFQRLCKGLRNECERLGVFPLAQLVDDYTILALARHWGIPVKLLDWTYNPLTAASFAVSRNSDNHSSSCATIWALELSNTEHVQVGVNVGGAPRTADCGKDDDADGGEDDDADGGEDPDYNKCVVFRPPSVDNVRLQNQDGLFTLLRASSDPLERWFESKIPDPDRRPLKAFHLDRRDTRAAEFVETVGADEDRLMPSVHRAVNTVHKEFEKLFRPGD